MGRHPMGPPRASTDILAGCERLRNLLVDRRYPTLPTSVSKDALKV